MKYNEFFAHMSPALSTRVIQYLRDEQREAYKQVVSGLASKKKLRPIFVQRKSTAQQIEWLINALKLPMGAEIGEQVLTLFLMHGRKEMLEQFLNDLEIDNEEGTVEDLPEALDPEKTRKAVDHLFEKHAADEVALYLAMFQKQTAEGFPELADILASDPRCNFGQSEG